MEIQNQPDPVPIAATKLTVLVEEDGLIRKLWKDRYRESGDRLVVFENPLDFLESLDRFSNLEEKVYFFFDQDFGRVRGVGVQLARAVQGKNRSQTVSLVTNYWPSAFRAEIRDKLVKYVFGKYPEPIFGEGYFASKLQTQPDLIRLACPYPQERTSLERAISFYGSHLEFTLEEHFPARVPNLKPTVEPVRTNPSQTTERAAYEPWWRRFVIFKGAEA